jgi:UDP-N-acetylmuramate--alanine ligase
MSAPSRPPPLPEEPEVPRAEELAPVHFVGIGGAGMSGIARVMLARGLAVTGSDAKDSRTLAALRALGARVYVGHRADQVATARTVVYSSAIRPSNPELVEAERRGLRMLPRAAALAAVMAGRRGIAVAGTHGKTTTTSMLTVALQHAGADPSYAIGGDLNEAGSNAHHGSGALFVAEADESDGSFLMLAPQAAVVTNIELDHVDYYRDLDAVRAAFHAFAGRIAADGFLVACADDPGARSLLEGAQAHGFSRVGYGVHESADVRVDEVLLAPSRASFQLVRHGVRLGAVQLAVPGMHNVLNAAGALAAGLELGQPFADLAAGLARFTGARRRFELKGVAGGVRVYDSYDHHPTELAAALHTARQAAGPYGRVLVVFQPHRYTRTRAFAGQLGETLGMADEVIVMEVYSAGEDPIPGVTGALVAAAVPLPTDRVLFESSWLAVPELVARRARAGDLVLTVGAGDVTMLGPELLRLLSRKG